MKTGAVFIGTEHKPTFMYNYHVTIKEYKFVFYSVPIRSNKYDPANDVLLSLIVIIFRV